MERVLQVPDVPGEQDEAARKIQMENATDLERE
jgi:hypothetical protein